MIISKVTGDGFHFRPVACLITVETMIHVIVDQRLFCISNRALYGLHLLSDFEAWSAILNHGNDGAKMPFGTFQPGDDFGVTCMKVVFCHMQGLSSPWGYRKMSRKMHQKGREQWGW